MRTKLSLIVGTLRWVLLILAAAPGLEAPLVAHPSQPIKPIRVWEGVASWYGHKFQGRKTASGERYDMFAQTVAHPTLPFGTLLRLVDKRTGKAQLVRVNDRGPYVEGRELDLSYAVATRLGVTDRGIGRVRIELLEYPRKR